MISPPIAQNGHQDLGPATSTFCMSKHPFTSWVRSPLWVMMKQLGALSIVVVESGAFQSVPKGLPPLAGTILTSTAGAKSKKLPLASLTDITIRRGARYTLHPLYTSPPNVYDPLPMR